MRVLLRTREFLGQCTNDAQKKSPGDCDRVTLSLADQSDPQTFLAEEVTSMFVTLARKLTAAHVSAQTGKPFSASALTDVVLTVPAWFGEIERTAVLDAALLAGMNPLATVNANTAAAIKYTLDSRGDTEKIRNETFLILDVGSTGTTASVGRVERGKTAKDKVKLVMMAHAWDKEVGGAALDNLIADRLAQLFDEKRGLQPDDTKAADIPAVMSRLRKEAQRVREVLSANTEAFCSVEALYSDMDFSGQITRKEFEAMAASLMDRVANPIKEALTKAGVKLADLNTVIPFGGVSRIPRIQEVVQKATKRETLNKSINADEAAVLGAAFYGATMSSRFQVRRIDVFDVVPYKVNSEISREVGVRKQGQRADLFPINSKVPSKKLMTVKRNDDFDVSVFMQGNEWLATPTLLGKFSIQGVAKVYDMLKNTTKEKAQQPKVALTFELDRSGLVNVQKTEVTLEETTTVQKEVVIKESTKPSESPKESPKDEGETKDGEQSPDASSPSPAPSTAKPKPKTKIETSQQTLVHRTFPTATLVKEATAHKSFKMTEEQLAESRKRLDALDEAEKARKAKADTLNALEGFVLEVRGKLVDDDFEEVSTEEERDKISAAFQEADDWLYTDEAKVLDKLVAKQKELNEMASPVIFRLTEKTARPQAVTEYEQYIEVVKNTTEQWLQLHREANSTHVEAIEKFSVDIEEVEEWFANVTAVQAERKLHEDPAFTSREVSEKIASLATKLRVLLKKKLPATPTPSPSPTESPSETEGDSTQKSEESPSADTVDNEATPSASDEHDEL